MEEAIRLNVMAVGISIFVGSEYERESLLNLAKLVDEGEKYGIPVIQTVHQYKLVCPNYRLYNPRTETICEKGLSGRFYHPVVERCHKDSVGAGALIAFESFLHRKTRIYEKGIDIFHVPSRFMGEKMRQAGVGDGKIRHLFYTIKVDEFEPQYDPADYLLYFGRLAREKGIVTLLKAMKNVPSARLKVAGDGPMRPEIETFIKENGLQNVELLGKKSGAALASLIRNARFVVVPSEWYDNSPLVIYESFAYGKPVIASQMGGMPELVDHEENGMLFEAGNVEELSSQISRLWVDSGTVVKFGKAGRRKAESEFAPQPHYERLVEWYYELLGGSVPIGESEIVDVALA
jgi:glycosyltransferase involved in cell wall biosynthesis